MDDVDITIGDGVMIAPSVTLTTTGHPVHPSHIGDDFFGNVNLAFVTRCPHHLR